MNPTTFNALGVIKRTHEMEEAVAKKRGEYEAALAELEQQKKYNTENINILWKEAALSCLEIEKDAPHFAVYFLKTPSFISECVAWNHGVFVTRDLKNKISSTLSAMYNKGELGRYEHPNGKSYYGLPDYFNNDLKTIKSKFSSHVSELAA